MLTDYLCADGRARVRPAGLGGLGGVVVVMMKEVGKHSHTKSRCNSSHIDYTLLCTKFE